MTFTMNHKVLTRKGLFTEKDFCKFNAAISEDEKLKSLPQNFLTALYLANKSLYNNVEKFEKLNKKKKKQTLVSLERYICRITNNCIPFGLFSFHQINILSDEKKETSVKSIQMSISPDSEWLSGVIASFEKNIEYIRELDVRISNIYMEERERINFFYKTGHFSCHHPSTINMGGYSIQNTELLDYTISRTLDWNKATKVASDIVNKFQVSEKEAYHYISFLISHDILYSNIRLSPVGKSSLDELMKVNNMNSENDQLVKSIFQMISAINTKHLMITVDQIKKIELKMEKLLKKDNYLQVDLYNFSSDPLDCTVKGKIQNVVNILPLLSFKTKNHYKLNKLREVFKENGWFGVLVPLLDCVKIAKVNEPDDMSFLQNSYFENLITLNLNHVNFHIISSKKAI